jgi:small subunit ribosomal protein S18
MGYRGNRSDRGDRRQGGGRFRRKRVCNFCVEKTEIDYKNYEMLRRYVNEYGRIKPRRQTGTCAKHQRALAVAIKRARHIALLPFVAD